MSGESSSHLLARERRDLDQIAESVREGRRIVAFLVCASELRSSVTGYLSERSGREVPSPVAAESPDEMLSLLTEAAGATAKDVRSVGFDPWSAGVLAALNMNREKLRRGASVLVWIPDVEGLRLLRRFAPDAFSFRDLLISVEGERTPEVAPSDVDHPDVRAARAQLRAARSRLARLRASAKLARELRSRHAAEESLAVLHDALRECVSPALDEGEMTEAALLHGEAARSLISDGRWVEAHRHVGEGLRILGERADPEANRRRFFLVHLARTPVGAAHWLIRGMVEEERLDPGDSSNVPLYTSVLFSQIERGDTRPSRALLKQLASMDVGTVLNRARRFIREAIFAIRIGRLSDVAPATEAAQALNTPYGVGNEWALLFLAERDILLGEVQPVREVLSRILRERAAEPILLARASRSLHSLRLACGDVLNGYAGLVSSCEQGVASRRDMMAFNACYDIAECVADACQAGRLSSADIESADTTLRDAQAAAIAISGDDPPWYHALYPVLRARILALLPDRLSEAIEMTRSALELCHRAYSDAAPMTGRILVGHLVKAGRFDEALSVIDRVTPQMKQERFLEELARVQGLAIVCLAALLRSPELARQATSDDIDAALSGLRATFDEMDAPRITADTLLELSLVLPADLRRPDPLSLLEEAYELFSEMRIVAKEARCLEAMGDVLSARGDLPGARRHHQMAREILERTGLLLRAPLLQEKLAALSA